MSPTARLTANGSPPSPTETTAAQRQALARTLQARALAQPDPLLANVIAITGDLAQFAYLLAPVVQNGLAEAPLGAEARRRFMTDCDIYLKLVRQFDRMAQLQHQGPAPNPTGSEELGN